MGVRGSSGLSSTRVDALDQSAWSGAGHVGHPGCLEVALILVVIIAVVVGCS